MKGPVIRIQSQAAVGLTRRSVLALEAPRTDPRQKADNEVRPRGAIRFARRLTVGDTRATIGRTGTRGQQMVVNRFAAAFGAAAVAGRLAPVPSLISEISVDHVEELFRRERLVE